MLPDSTVPGSLTGLLAVFRSCFTTPTFTTLSAVIVGLIAQTRRRTVCGITVFGVFWHHDGAAKGPKPIGFGNCWLPRFVALAAAWTGLLAVIWPHDQSSPGRAWGAALICWALLFAAAVEVETRRDPAQDVRPAAVHF
jgi:hypothetical protein